MTFVQALTRETVFLACMGVVPIQPMIPAIERSDHTNGLEMTGIDLCQEGSIESQE